MKINGRVLNAPNEEILVLPRKEGNIVLKARGVIDQSNFEKLCPKPVPPNKLIKGGQKVADVEAPLFKEALNDWAKKKTYWIILESLKATENLEWETIDLSDPNTWGNFDTELKSSGFSTAEIDLIMNLVLSANSLDDEKLQQARDHFLLTLAVDAK